MTLLDSSGWIEFLRGTPTRATAWVRGHIGRDLDVCDPILMEILAGARPGPSSSRIERLLLAQQWRRLEPAVDYRGAVDVFHATRATGRPPRSLQDCLIAAVALRHDVAVAHRDIDFENIAVATGLETVDLRE